MIKAVLMVVGLSLVGLTVGCGADAQTSETDHLASSKDKVMFSHVWDVHTVINGVTQYYYPPDDASLLSGLGFPMQMYDDGASPSANSGWLCYLAPSSDTDGGWVCQYSSNFSADNFVHTGGGGSNYPKDIRVKKPVNSGNWQADWGTGGPGYSYVYYAKYGQ